MKTQPSLLSPAQIAALDRRIYRLKITLEYTKPPVWRRLEVYGGISMDSLATAIETAFGWSGEHMAEFEVEKIVPAEPGVGYPRCTDGARADPIEDCGGPWGFEDLVAAAGNPKHQRFAHLEEWGLEKWNPARFSAEEVSRKLAKVFRRRKRRV